jgi:hypothetical protein
MHDTIQNPLLLITYAIGWLVLLAALIYATIAWRRRRRGTIEAARDAATRRAFTEDSEREPAAPMRSERHDAPRFTEDDLARADLGGTRGAPQLGEAPMVPQQAKNTPRRFEPGHTA